MDTKRTICTELGNLFSERRLVRWHFCVSGMSITNLIYFHIQNTNKIEIFDQQDHYVFISSLNVSNGRLLKLLLLLDYSNGVRFAHVASKFYPTVLDALKSKQVTIERQLDLMLYYLPRERALEFKIEWVKITVYAIYIYIFYRRLK